MTKEEIKELIKDNLRVEVKIVKDYYSSYSDVKVKLLWKDEDIDFDSDTFKQGN
jgi:hypothetical protein